MANATLLPQQVTVFISYSRQNRPFAHDLYGKLDELGFKLWRDVHDIEAGAEDWWEAIKEGIRECDTLILCMSMPALQSPVVSDEWYYARQQGKRVIPVVADEIWEHPDVKSGSFTIPKWMTRRNWIDYREGQPEADVAWHNLITTLRTPYQPKPFIDMVEELPPRYVRRVKDMDRAIRSLVDDNNDAIAMTTALKGAGGYGKTTLAKAVARDLRVHGAFDDGILWVTLGESLLEKKGDALVQTLIDKVQDLVHALTAERPVMNTLELAKTRLKEAIGERYILLVIDDVWDEIHLKPFLVKGKNSSCLITTRNLTALGSHEIVKYEVGRMKPVEAVELLSAGFAPDEVEPLKAELQQFARDLREYPQLLALANFNIASWKEDMGISLAEALQFARETFDEQGITGFDDEDTDDRTRAVDASLKVSLNQLKPDERRRYLELAIFGEDATIPLTTLEAYWSMSKVETRKFCSKLYRKTALLHSFEGQAIRIHDVFRDYLLRQHAAEALRDLHRRLLDAWQNDYHNLPDEYSWRHIAYHLTEAGKAETLRELLLDYEFLQAKLDATDPNAIIADCSYLPDDETIRLMQSALNLSANILSQYPDQLPYQIVGRLWMYRDKLDIAPLWRYCHRITPLELIETQKYPPMAPVGGALLKILKGHTREINGAVELSDGRLLSWSKDTTLWLWDRDGNPLAELIGHRDEVKDACELSDGRLLSWSSDKTLRLWNAEGNLLRILEGHTGEVRGACELSDRRLLTWSWGELILWDHNGAFLAELTGHVDVVLGGTELPDGRLQSWSRSERRFWDRDGTYLGEQSKYTGETASEFELSKRQLPFESNAKRQWDNKKLEAHLRGYPYTIQGVVTLSDERLLVWSDDRKLHLWDSNGKQRNELIAHQDSVWVLFELLEGRLLSGSENGTLRLWGRDGNPLAELVGHIGEVWRTLELSDGRLLSWARDKTLRLWDHAGNSLAVLEDWRHVDKTRQHAWAEENEVDLRMLFEDNFEDPKSTWAKINDNQLMVPDAGSFVGDDIFTALAAQQDRLTVSDIAGRVIFLRVRNPQ